MIWTTDARKLLKELNEGNSTLILDSLTITVAENTLAGRGTLRRSKGRFQLSARFDSDKIQGSIAKFFFGGIEGSQIYSSDDFWHMSASTSSGIKFECRVAPPHHRKVSSDGTIEIRSSINRLNLPLNLLDATSLQFFEQTLEKLNEPGALEEGFTVSFDPPEPVPSRFHAILPGVKCLLADQSTTIERRNVFIPTVTSQKLDTYVDEDPDRRIGLVEDDGDLHVYLELTPNGASEEEERASFSALLDAIAFTHGCQPFPILKEHSRGGRIVNCEIAAVEDAKTATIKPLTDNFVHFHPKSRSMLRVAFRFFEDHKAIVTRIRKAMWLYREAASESVPLPIKVLTACTLFEGLVKNLFDAHGLNGPMKIGEVSVNFAANKKAAKELLMEKHSELMTDSGVESDWSRMAGYLNNSEFVRHTEKLKAVADHFGFKWENDVELIHKIWSRHRNPLAHGEGLKGDFNSISELFQCWSRLSGSIHRFILAEMGYVGSFNYSPMEPGLVEMDLKVKA